MTDRLKGIGDGFISSDPLEKNETTKEKIPQGQGDADNFRRALGRKGKDSSDENEHTGIDSDTQNERAEKKTPPATRDHDKEMAHTQERLAKDNKKGEKFALKQEVPVSRNEGGEGTPVFERKDQPTASRLEAHHSGSQDQSGSQERDSSSTPFPKEKESSIQKEAGSQRSIVSNTEKNSTLHHSLESQTQEIGENGELVFSIKDRTPKHTYADGTISEREAQSTAQPVFKESDFKELHKENLGVMSDSRRPLTAYELGRPLPPKQGVGNQANEAEIFHDELPPRVTPSSEKAHILEKDNPVAKGFASDLSEQRPRGNPSPITPQVKEREGLVGEITTKEPTPLKPEIREAAQRKDPALPDTDHGKPAIREAVQRTETIENRPSDATPLKAQEQVSERGQGIQVREAAQRGESIPLNREGAQLLKDNNPTSREGVPQRNLERSTPQEAKPLTQAPLQDQGQGVQVRQAAPQRETAPERRESTPLRNLEQPTPQEAKPLTQAPLQDQGQGVQVRQAAPATSERMQARDTLSQERPSTPSTRSEKLVRQDYRETSRLPTEATLPRDQERAIPPRTDLPRETVNPVETPRRNEAISLPSRANDSTNSNLGRENHPRDQRSDIPYERRDVLAREVPRREVDTTNPKVESRAIEQELVREDNRSRSDERPRDDRAYAANQRNEPHRPKEGDSNKPTGLAAVVGEGMLAGGPTGVDASGATRAAELHEVISQLVSQLTTLQKSGQTETVMTLNHPPLFNGAQLVLTEFGSAQGEFNLAFHNLSPEALLLLSQQVHQELLRQGLENKGFALHILHFSEQPAEQIFTQGGQSDNFGEDDRGGDGSSDEQSRQGSQERENPRDEL